MSKIKTMEQYKMAFPSTRLQHHIAFIIVMILCILSLTAGVMGGDTYLLDGRSCGTARRVGTQEGHVKRRKSQQEFISRLRGVRHLVMVVEKYGDDFEGVVR